MGTSDHLEGAAIDGRDTAAATQMEPTDVAIRMQLKASRRPNRPVPPADVRDPQSQKGLL